MYNDQEDFWDDIGWLADESGAVQTLTAAFGTDSWRSDEGDLLYRTYQRMDSGGRDKVDQALDLATPDEKLAELTRLFSGVASGDGAGPTAATQETAKDTGVYADATDLAGDADPAWQAYAGWWRRLDGSTWKFARSNRRDDTWVDQNTMVAQAGQAPAQPAQPQAETAQPTVYADATELAADPDPAWRAYAGWWRRLDGSTWKFARSNRRDDTWVDQNTMVAQAAAPAAAAPAAEPMAPTAASSEPAEAPVMVSVLDNVEIELPPPPSTEDLPDELFDEEAELTDADIDRIIADYPQIQEVVQRVLTEAADSIAASPALDAVMDLDDEEIEHVVETVGVIPATA
ncbi:hypothetical protein OG738_21480 [Amycolatopsis sp. NBC_01488]|uniref:hypothetical protein n=1 Tax=Amycolatopsis sp. NBC_01488 TaxID=2903563 RepID=UPI002E2C7CA9|nr:hypothetical protein [Amycolatopsis sp. NBC_01488]